MSMQGVKVGRKETKAWTTEDQSFALIIAMLNIMGSGLTEYAALKSQGEDGAAKRHAADVFNTILKLWPQPDRLAQAASYMAEDLGFTVEAVPVTNKASQTPN